MTRLFNYNVTVFTDSIDHAEMVMAERLGYDEQYEDENGDEFPYEITSYVVVPNPSLAVDNAVDDVIDSFRLALTEAHVNEDLIDQVVATVIDYYTNHYGE